MEWVTNAVPPESWSPMAKGDLTHEQYEDWFYQFDVGEPQMPTVPNACTVPDLKRMGYVGLYRVAEADQPAVVGGETES